MKSYRRIIAVVMALAMLLAMSACGAEPAELTEAVRIGTLNGPTGMGLIDLADNDLVELETYQAPDEVVQKLISGDIDVACLPSNMGAVLNAKTDGGVQVLTTIVNGVLYLVENGTDVVSVENLEGKTIYASGKGGTPEYVLQAVLESAGLTIGEDVQVEWMDAHADVAQKVIQTEGAVALLPEPFVSTVISKSDAVTIAIDMNDAWQELTGQELPMGILIAKRDYIQANTENIDALLELVAASIEDVNGASDEVIAKIVEAGFIGDAGICAGAIPNLSLVCLDSGENQETLSAFYSKLYEIAPAAVGGSLPSEELYY